MSPTEAVRRFRFLVLARCRRSIDGNAGAVGVPFLVHGVLGVLHAASPHAQTPLAAIGTKTTQSSKFCRRRKAPSRGTL